MSLETIANGLETLLEGVTGFSAGQVAQEDYTVLNKGIAKAMVIHYAGQTREVEQVALSGGFNLYHAFDIELFEQYKSPSQTINDLRDDLQLIMTRIHQYPNLNGTAGVFGARVVSVEPLGTPPAELVAAPNRWRMGVIRCEVWEQDTAQHLE